ncbi:MAG: DUF998 domain-containing protein [Candidatus Thorarchaeota archaeon]|nr:DUF998 domain-containing protein [Candidatus Thorarchaeota archaeon]
MERRFLFGFIGPILSLLCVLLAIALAPSFDWTIDALSHLGHWFRTDIGPNPAIRAVVFNGGLFVGGMMAIYYFTTLIQATTDLPSKIGFLGPTAMCTFLAGVGIFSENFDIGHLITALGFFFAIPVSAALVGLMWLRIMEVRIFGVLLLVLALLATLLFQPWTSIAIWEYVLAIVSTTEILFIVTLDKLEHLDVLKNQ